MSEFKGTKGVWVIGTAFKADTKNIHIKTDGKLITVEDCDGIAVAIVGRISEEAQEANAKLIAAAPELLEALEMCFNALQTYGKHPIIKLQVEAVINKATL